jgi:phosphinothricin acetyltransferase
MNAPPRIRPSTAADVPAIAAIYGYHVLNGVASFELDPPDDAEIARRRESVLALGLPYLVAELDGEVVGYSYASLYRPRPAYRFTLENSVYVHHQMAGRGIGRLLLNALIEECTAAGYHQMIAVIGGSDNTASMALHAACGFERAALLHEVGWKFGRWVDSVFMQRTLKP